MNENYFIYKLKYLHNFLFLINFYLFIQNPKNKNFFNIYIRSIINKIIKYNLKKIF